MSFLSRSRTNQHSSRSHGAFAFLRCHIFFFNLSALSLIVVFVIAYIVQINRVTITGYQIRDLEGKISKLEEQNQREETALTEVRSMDHIAKTVPMLGMVSVESSRYISAQETGIAFNR